MRRGWGVAERYGVKAVLSVLVKNYVFELLDGPETKIEVGRGILPRPRIGGDESARMPMRVRRGIEG